MLAGCSFQSSVHTRGEADVKPEACFLGIQQEILASVWPLFDLHLTSPWPPLASSWTHLASPLPPFELPFVFLAVPLTPRDTILAICNSFSGVGFENDSFNCHYIPLDIQQEILAPIWPLFGLHLASPWLPLASLWTHLASLSPPCNIL
jgi:hypothetical protein